MGNWVKQKKVGNWQGTFCLVFKNVLGLTFVTWKEEQTKCIV